MAELDNQDLLILTVLRLNCRLSLREVGQKVGLSAPSVAARVKRLEESGVIAGYSLKLCPPMTGLNVEALIFISVPYALWTGFAQKMESMLCVLSLERITGAFSHLIRANFEDAAHLDSFVSFLNQNFGPTQTSLVLNHTLAPRDPLPANAPVVDKKKSD